jgi:hypothetical protein
MARGRKTIYLKGAMSWQTPVIAVFVIVLIGASIYFYQSQKIHISLFPPQQESQENGREEEPDSSDQKTDEEMINEGKEQFLPDKAEFGTAALVDLNNNGHKEVVLGARIIKDLDENRKCFSGYLLVVEETEDDYRKIGEFTFDGLYNLCGFSFIPPGIPKDPETNELRYEPTDFDADGVKEIITWLPPGVSQELFGVLKVGFKAEKIDWLRVRESQGQIVPLLSLGLGGSVIYSADFMIRDTNGNGIKEIITIACYHPSGDFQDAVCQTEAYEWDKEMVSHNAELASHFSLEDFY